MTELQRLYQEARAGGGSHVEAIAVVARSTGIDVASVMRSLQRARHEDRGQRRPSK